MICLIGRGEVSNWNHHSSPRVTADIKHDELAGLDHIENRSPFINALASIVFRFGDEFLGSNRHSDVMQQASVAGIRQPNLQWQHYGNEQNKKNRNEEDQPDQPGE